MLENNTIIGESVQNYLKTIYKLSIDNSEVTTSDVAKALGITSASVTGMLKRLSAMKLVNYSSYKGVSLSQDGKDIALEVLRHHRLLETYLRNSLGYKLAQLHEEACRLEHYVSDEFIDKLTNILGDPEYDPYGNPIPRKDGEVPIREEISLIALDPIVTGMITRIENPLSELLNYLDEIGLLPGKEITLIEKGPYFGPIRLKMEDKEISIGHEVGKTILLSMESIRKS
jgi:DtxR family Mn-dependent transcriptional regulator